MGNQAAATRQDRRDREQRQPPVVGGRVPPHDLDAEAAVLSAVLLEPGAVDRVIGLVKPRDMYSEANHRILEAVYGLAAVGTPVDIALVAGWLRDRDRLAQVGGAAYLAQLADAVPSVANLEDYARRVAEKSAVRKLISTCQQYAAEGYGDYGETKAFIDSAEQAIYEIARPSNTVELEHVSPIQTRVYAELTEAASRGERITGFPTGFERLDAKTAGLHDGELTIIAARPGMGKTSLALNVAVNVAMGMQSREGRAVPIFSIEMPKEQLVQRMQCSLARVDLGKVRQGFLQTRDWQALTQTANFFNTLPIYIDDSNAPNVLDLRGKLRRLQADLDRQPAPKSEPGGEEKPKRRIGLAIVDYLQLMAGVPGTFDGREQEISSISRGLKGLAKEMKIPVIALAQLNRAVETRGVKEKRPQLSDLRESGAIEQDADNIIFIYRDDYYRPKDSQEKGIAELIVAKQRNGPTGTIKVHWDGALTRFDNLAPGEGEGEHTPEAQQGLDYPQHWQDR